MVETRITQMKYLLINCAKMGGGKRLIVCELNPEGGLYGGGGGFATAGAPELTTILQ